MPTAIKLSFKTLDVIAETLKLHIRVVREELDDANAHGKAVYYVRDALYGVTRMSYLIYDETDFLDSFATIPDGIDDHFVKVTQVKSP